MRDESIQLVEGAIGHDPAKVPCRECPLRKDAVPGALGGWTPSMYVRGLHGPADIACHMSKGFQERDISQQRSCTGVAAYRANVGWNAAHPLSHATKAVAEVEDNQTAREMSFEDPWDFYWHHTCEEGERAGYAVPPRGAGE